MPDPEYLRVPDLPHGQTRIQKVRLEYQDIFCKRRSAYPGKRQCSKAAEYRCGSVQPAFQDRKALKLSHEYCPEAHWLSDKMLPLLLSERYGSLSG